MLKNSAWEKFEINSLVIKCLLENNFINPTEAQSASLPYYQYKTDLILASKTGSGKTLCFGIPVFSDLINELGLTSEYDGETDIQAPKRRNVKALVLTPTRELAIQIKNHFERLNLYTKKYIKIGVIVGGLSKEKQLRILSRRPQILIATPGRLWDLLDKDFNPYLQTLRKTEYLILDEADKMIELGHFKELDKILSFIYSKELSVKEKKLGRSTENDQELLEDLYIKGPGGKMISLNDPSLGLINDTGDFIDDELEGEAIEDLEDQEELNENEETFEEEMLEDNDEGEEEKIKDQNDSDDNNQDDGEFIDAESKEDGNENAEQDSDMNESSTEGSQKKVKKSNKNKEKNEPVIKRRTIVLSATLASSDDPESKKAKSKKNKKTKVRKMRERQKQREQAKLKGAEATTIKLQNLMKKIQFNGKPKLIDLTQESKLPETLKEFKCLCTDEEKILYLYHFIHQNIGQNFIVFTNTIPAVKRVYSVLIKLGVKASCLHSEMQQRQRLKKLEKFAKGESLVLVCTDVASRGLDIPQVNFVVHYQIPRDCDTYIHRSGRTARIGREGTAYALVGPQEKSNYLNICRKLREGQGIQTITLSQSEMDKVTQMVEAATKLEHGEFLLEKKKKEKEWFTKNARQAEILLDEEIQDHLEGVSEEITKKRRILTNNKINYQKIQQDTGRKLINPAKSKAVFLDPSQIANIANMLNSTKSQTPSNNRNRSRSKSKRH